MQVQQNYPLKKYNTFGINAYSKYFSAFATIEDLELILEEYAEQSTLILGGGSNLLFTKNYTGIVLKNNLSGIDIVDEDDNYIYVKAGAGENWHQFVLYCVQNNFSGVENLSLIPGNIGACPMQNIGAYGVEIKDVFHSLEAFHVKERKKVNFDLNDCEFGYRDSVFKKI
ncbi:MAG: FAD-binding protein [Chitinophagaceae bacterium]